CGTTGLHAHRTQGKAGVHIAVEGDPPDRSAVPAARRAFVRFDKTDRPKFRRAGHRHLPGMAQKTVERIERLGQYAFDMIDGVDQARIELDLAPADDPNTARDRDP